jgi:hypothetical protein
MPPDASTLPGNDHQDRVLAYALHGTNSPNPAAGQHAHRATAATLSDLEKRPSCHRSRADGRGLPQWHGLIAIITEGPAAFYKMAAMSSTASSPAKRPVPPNG